jgi:L-seryl-tRNA(Ser) seleniumtransferase
MRAMRVGKMTLAALAATLRLYRDQQSADQEIPILRMLSMPVENLELRASKIAQQISYLPFIGSCDVVEDQAMLGGGSLPTQKIPTWGVSIEHADNSIQQLANRLRNSNPSVIGRVQKDRLFLDMRTVQPSQDADLVSVFERLNQKKENLEA